MKLVPEDFPRPAPAGVSGAQPKLAGRMVEGGFIEGLTDEELQARHEACHDLAEQLIEYAKRKRVELAGLPLREFLRRLRAGVVKKRWDIDTEELTWVMGRVSEAMGGGPADIPDQEVLLPVQAVESTHYRHVPSVVDVALGQLGGGPASRDD